MSAGVTMGAGADAGEGRGGALVVSGVLVIAVWSAAVVTGLGRMLYGRDATGLHELALLAPGVVVGAGLVLVGAVRRLRVHAPRWVPRERPAPVEVAAVVPADPEPDALPLAQPLPPDVRRAPPELAIVHLGPGADPAWAAWGIAWEAPGHGAGFVPLPSGARIGLGRDPGAQIVARLDQVSWRHLELDVQESRVIVVDVGSSNGTRTSPEGAPVAAQAPIPWAPGEALYLANPVALKLVLEPLR